MAMGQSLVLEGRPEGRLGQEGHVWGGLTQGAGGRLEGGSHRFRGCRGEALAWGDRFWCWLDGRTRPPSWRGVAGLGGRAGGRKGGW